MSSPSDDDTGKDPIRRYFAGEPLSQREWTESLESESARREFNERAAPLSDTDANALVARHVLSRIEEGRRKRRYAIVASAGMAAAASVGLVVSTRPGTDTTTAEYREKGSGKKGLPLTLQCIPKDATREDQVIRSAESVIRCPQGSQIGATTEVPSADWHHTYLVILQATPSSVTVMSAMAGKPGALAFDPSTLSTGAVRLGPGETLVFLLATQDPGAGAAGEAQVRAAAQSALEKPLSNVRELGVPGFAETRISIQAGPP